MILLPLILALTTAYASQEAKPKNPDVLSVSAERNSFQWGGQTIQFVIQNNRSTENRKATLFLSSNFIGRPSETVRLGHYEANDLKRMEFDRDLLANWQNGLSMETKEFADIDRLNPGMIRVYVGGFRLDPHAPLRADAMTFLERVWDLANWIPVESVQITKKKGSESIVLRYKGKVAFREKKKISDFDCKRDKAKLVCNIPRFGTAYLLP
jgi:hypothetical protein